MPTPGVQDFQLIAPLQFKSHPAQWTRVSISAAKDRTHRRADRRDG